MRFSACDLLSDSSGVFLADTFIEACRFIRNTGRLDKSLKFLGIGQVV
jgi:hypothetical protein